MRGFWRRQSGTISMWLVWGILPMVGFASLAVDIGYLAVIDTQLQVAADTSAEVALGAVQRGGTQLAGKGQAIAYAGFNKVLGSGPVLAPEDVVFGDYDYATSTFRPGGLNFSPAVRVVTRRAVDFLLAPALGVNAGDVTGIATAAAGCREIAMAIDVTASFVVDFGEVAQAMHDVIDEIASNAREGDSLGLVAFAANAVTVLPLRPIPAAQNQLEIAVDSVYEVCPDFGAATTVMTMPAGSCQGTDHAAGIDEAISILQLSASDCGAEQLIILISDGPPCNLLGPGGTPSGAVAAAARADAAGISIVPIMLLNNSGGPQDCPSNAGADSALNDLLARGFGRPAATFNPNQLGAFAESSMARIPVRLVE